MTKFIVDKNAKRLKYLQKSIAKTIKFGTSGIVDKVVVFKNKDSLRTYESRVFVKIRIRI